MKNLMLLGAVMAVAALTGCASSPAQYTGNTSAYTTPPAYHYQAPVTATLTTSNPGSLFSPNDNTENNDL